MEEDNNDFGFFLTALQQVSDLKMQVSLEVMCLFYYPSTYVKVLNTFSQPLQQWLLNKCV